MLRCPLCGTDNDVSDDACLDGTTHELGGRDRREPTATIMVPMMSSAMIEANRLLKSRRPILSRFATQKFLVKVEVKIRAEFWIEADTEAETIQSLEGVSAQEIADSAVSEPVLEDTWVAAKLGLPKRF